MIEELRELYVISGPWANPILISTLILFLAGSVMLFTVRLIKRFILFTIVALVLPSGIGFVGYLEEVDSLEEAVVERGAEFTEEMIESAEELSLNPIYLGILGSVVAVGIGIAGIVKIGLSGRSPTSTSKEST